jgi:hypothetical protein
MPRSVINLGGSHDGIEMNKIDWEAARGGSSRVRPLHRGSYYGRRDQIDGTEAQSRTSQGRIRSPRF